MRRLLLDTQVALWWLTAHPRLDTNTQALIADSECHLSAASVWEVAIKYKLGKLEIAPHTLMTAAREAQIRLLSVTPEHSAATVELPLLHGDPFDRLLVAQAHLEHLQLVTADNRISQYGKPIGGDILFL